MHAPVLVILVHYSLRSGGRVEPASHDAPEVSSLCGLWYIEWTLLIDKPLQRYERHIEKKVARRTIVIILQRPRRRHRPPLQLPRSRLGVVPRVLLCQSEPTTLDPSPVLQAHREDRLARRSALRRAARPSVRI